MHWVIAHIGLLFREPVEQMDVTQALQEVLKIANHRRGLAKGLHEVAKVLGE